MRGSPVFGRAQRSAATAKTYEEWKATVFKEPFEGGSFIVNGDTKIPDEKHLREFYDEMKALNQSGSDTLTPPHEVALTVATDGGLDAVWNAVDKLRLTYCVSDAFGAIDEESCGRRRADEVDRLLEQRQPAFEVLVGEIGDRQMLGHRPSAVAPSGPCRSCPDQEQMPRSLESRRSSPPQRLRSPRAETFRDAEYERFR